MKTPFITDFKVHQLLWKSHVGVLSFYFCLLRTPDGLALAPWRGDVSPCSCWHPWEQLSLTTGWPAARLNTQTCDFSWSKIILFFTSPASTVSIEACQLPELCLPARNLLSLPSCPQWASEAQPASGASGTVAAKTWQLLQQDSLGSFKMPFSVTSGMFNNWSSLHCAQIWGVFLFYFFFFISPSRVFALRA